MVTIGGTEASKVEFSGLVTLRGRTGRGRPPQALFSFTTFYFASNATVPYGDTVLDIPSNSLKFTVSVKEWPFRDMENSLSFGVDVSFNSRNRRNRVSNRVEGAGIRRRRRSRAELGDVDVVSPLFAIADGLEVEIASDLRQRENGIVLLTWTFPSFEGDIVYDPVVNPANEGIVFYL